tara:strand:+ start:56 stop:637 length:582 start_codon:yes stop_codon:yes gene_type:complete
MRKTTFTIIILFFFQSVIAQNELYVPFDKGETDFPKGVDQFWAKVYTEFLIALKEDKIDTLKTKKEIYRFLWLRTFHNPIVIRIEKNNKETTLFWKRSNGEGGYDAGKIVENKSIKLTQKEWSEFKELLNNSKFWKNPSIKNDRNIIPATDGAQWVLEGIKTNEYHISEINVFKPCLYLIKLTKMNIPKNEIY